MDVAIEGIPQVLTGIMEDQIFVYISILNQILIIYHTIYIPYTSIRIYCLVGIDFDVAESVVLIQLVKH